MNGAVILENNAYTGVYSIIERKLSFTEIMCGTFWDYWPFPPLCGLATSRLSITTLRLPFPWPPPLCNIRNAASAGERPCHDWREKGEPLTHWLHSVLHWRIWNGEAPFGAPWPAAAAEQCTEKAWYWTWFIGLLAIYHDLQKHAFYATQTDRTTYCVFESSI